MTSLEIAEYLRNLSGVTLVKPGRVVLDDVTYESCYYELIRAGLTEKEERIYLLGEIPKELLKEYLAFTMSGDCRDWYVSCYILKKNITERTKEFAPFGPCFMVAPWTAKDKIDAGQPRAYIRMHLQWHSTKGERNAV